MKNLVPEKLKKARKLRGLSMESLARNMGYIVSKQSISKYEKGVMQPTSEVLCMICKTLDLPLSYFGSDRIFIDKIDFRIDKRVPVRSVNQMVAMAEDKISQYLEIESLLAISSSFSNPVSDFVICNEDDTELAAELLRKEWNLGTMPIFSVFEMLESVGTKILEFDTGVRHVIGFSTFVNRTIPLIVVNVVANGTTERKRFTALHELGHLLLCFAHNMEASVKERLCNYFAGAVLCPQSVMFSELGTKRSVLTLNELVSMKNRYGISVSALVHRAKDLGIINHSYYNHIYDNHIHQNPMEYGWGAYPIQEQTNRYERLVQRAIAEHVSSEEDLAELLHDSTGKYTIDTIIL